MIVATCLLQYVAVVHKPPHQPDDTSPCTSVNRTQAHTTWAAIVVAASLHVRADQAVPYRFVGEALVDAARAGVTPIGFVSAPDKPNTR